MELAVHCYVTKSKAYQQSGGIKRETTSYILQLVKLTVAVSIFVFVGVGTPVNSLHVYLCTWTSL